MVADPPGTSYRNRTREDRLAQRRLHRYATSEAILQRPGFHHHLAPVGQLHRDDLR